jgi:hypothetical protein
LFQLFLSRFCAKRNISQFDVYVTYVYTIPISISSYDHKSIINMQQHEHEHEHDHEQQFPLDRQGIEQCNKQTKNFVFVVMFDTYLQRLSAQMRYC